MEKRMTSENTGKPVHVIFNYNDVFFSFFYDGGGECFHRSRDFAMNYVYSKVGFKTPSHFSTAFKRQYVMPPTAVRNNGI